MKHQFNNRLEAIQWIAANAEDEGKFEVMREHLNFNFIYFGEYFIDQSIEIGEVILLRNNPSHDCYL